MRVLLKWGPALLFFGVTLAFSLSFYYRAPYHDHWSLVHLFARLQEGTLGPSDLFALHGGHWHASGYILQLGLSEMTGMGHWAESLASVLIAGLGFLALMRILRRTETPSAMAWLVGIAAFFVFSLDQAGNWLWGWQVAVFLNLAGALWTIERLSCGAPSLRNTGLAVLAAAVSIYAFATGWMLIPIGFALLSFYGGWKTRRGLACVLIWLGFSVAIGLHYALAKSAAPAIDTGSTLPPLTDLSAVLGVSHYTLNYIASPIVRFARDISVPITLLGGGVLIAAVRALYREDPQTVWRRTTPILALAVYAAGAGFLTALGRWEMYGAKQAFVSRYISFGSLYWVAVFTLAILVIARLRDRSHRVLWGVMGLLLVLKIGNIPSVVQKSVRISTSIQTASAEIAQTYPETAPADYAVLHSPLQSIESELAVLHAHRISMFSKVPEADKYETASPIVESESP